MVAGRPLIDIGKHSLVVGLLGKGGGGGGGVRGGGGGGEGGGGEGGTLAAGVGRQRPV